MQHKTYFVLLIVCLSSGFCYSEAVSTVITLPHSELKQICQGLEFQFVTHPTNQQKYIICIPGGGVEKECEAGQCFDERSPPCSANCNANLNAADQTVKSYCNNDDTTVLDRVANDKDCESYYLCMGKNVDPLPQRCPTNQHYVEERKTCLSYAAANCVSSSKWCKKRKDGTRFPHLKCYKYYECENQMIASKSCLYGEHFDEDLGKCASGICWKDKRTPDCKEQNDGTCLIHSKCYKYFVCLNQSLFEAQCPNGYYFNKISVSCVRDVSSSCTHN